jgi:3-deoxy-manno-octulosonate cytidylyltransferase (CMP-KDO synthetase)
MSNLKKSVIIIPARLAARRLPNKPLIDIEGVPMIIRVYNQALKSNVGKVVVAGCDKELQEVLYSYGYNYINTDPKLPSGTDRICEGYKNLNEKFDIVINLQGDMPHVNPETIRKVNALLMSEEKQDVDISTAASKISGLQDEINDKNTVKVIKSYKNDAIYFTRYPVKFNENYKHIGIYGFKEESLQKFVSLPQSPLEKYESLEQLRAIENGMKIKVAISQDPNISIDVEEDLAKSENYLKKYEK